jgi:RNA polymerase sigma-70 factor (ECF subfamily)
MSDENLASISDEDLAFALQSGAAPGAFAELWRRHNSSILATCRRIVRNQAWAEEIGQETFLRAITRIHQFKSGNFGGWLQTIAHNLCINHLQKASTRHERTGDEVTLVKEPARDTGWAKAGSELTEQILECLAALGDEQRLVLKFLYLHDYSYEEVSRKTGFKPDAVRSHAQNGRRMFAKIWREKFKGGLPQT